MFNIGPSEMFLLGVLFLFLFGPEKLPEIARAFGQAINAFREHSRTITHELTRQLEQESLARSIASTRSADDEERQETRVPAESQPMSAVTPPPEIEPSVAQSRQEPALRKRIWFSTSPPT